MQNSSGTLLYPSNGIEENDPQIDRVSLTLAANWGTWMTLDQIAALSGVANPASVASRIRDLRVEGQIIQRRAHPASGGRTRIFEYRRIG
jgi:hypothetical protein